LVKKACQEQKKPKLTPINSCPNNY